MRLLSALDAVLLELISQKDFVQQAKDNIELLGLKESCKVIHGDARRLDFEKESFDVIIIEAMLAMLSKEERARALSDYYDLLKPGGYLLTQDVIVKSKDSELIGDLSTTVNKQVDPETYLGLQTSLIQTGLEIRYCKSDRVRFIFPDGLIADEGAIHAAEVISRGQEPENIKQFEAIKSFFTEHADKLRYVCFISQKI